MGDAAGTMLYICDRLKIWQYVFSTRIVSVVAGTSSATYSDDSFAAATSAPLNRPTGIWLTTSNVLYVADTQNYAFKFYSQMELSGVAVVVDLEEIIMVLPLLQRYITRPLSSWIQLVGSL
jgi:hypothetical protein